MPATEDLDADASFSLLTGMRLVALCSGAGASLLPQLLMTLPEGLLMPEGLSEDRHGSSAILPAGCYLKVSLYFLFSDRLRFHHYIPYIPYIHIYIDLDIYLFIYLSIYLSI